MKLKAIYKLLIARLKNNYSTTSVAWPNKKFEVAGVKEYIKPFIKFGEVFEGEIAENGVFT